MSRVCDFNLLKTGETKASNQNTNSVNVVVNQPAPTVNFSREDISEDSAQVIYPPPPAALLPQSANVEMPTQKQSNELEFYKLLSAILSDVLKDNNPKLIVNVIDQSGKIIIKAQDLVRLIAIKTAKDVKDVNLRYREPEPGCMSKVSPIKLIEDIKIKNESFALRYNADFNILKDDFNISLEKTII